MLEELFDSDALGQLYGAHRATLTRLAGVGLRLEQRFYRMEEPVTGLLLALASGESLLLVGPPGTAKSRLVRSFCQELGLLEESLDPRPGELARGDEAYFEYLLTPFTEPSELFGFYDLAKLQSQSRLERIENNTLQRAQVVFLDEVFNASSAILNALLTVLHEGILHDRERRVHVALECLVGATNDVPQRSELLAFYDRFLLRCPVENLGAEENELGAYRQGLGELVAMGWRESYGSAERAERLSAEEGKGLLADLARLRRELGTLRPRPGSFGDLAYLIHGLRQQSLAEMSNRRVIKMCFVLVVHRLLRAARHGEAVGPLTLGPDEESLIRRFFLDQRDDLREDQLFDTPAPGRRRGR